MEVLGRTVDVTVPGWAQFRDRFQQAIAAFRSPFAVLVLDLDRATTIGATRAVRSYSARWLTGARGPRQRFVFLPLRPEYTVQCGT